MRLLPAPSLRLRLTLLWCAVCLTVLVGLELLTLTVLSAQMTASADRAIAMDVRNYQRTVAGATDLTDLRHRAWNFLAADSDAGHGYPVVYRIEFQNGQVLQNSGDLQLVQMVAAVRPPPGRPATVPDPHHHRNLRVATVAIDQDGRHVGDLLIAIPFNGVQLGDLLTPLLAANTGVIALGALLAYLLVGRALRPVRSITTTAAGISEGDLSRRIGYRGPRDEVGRLAETFDAMLGRLQTGFEQRQAFYSLASHELRTPLTIVRGHLEVLRRSRDPEAGEVREALDIALEELGHVTTQVDDMLLLGRMLLGQHGPLEEVDAAAVVKDVFRRARNLAGRDWQLDLVEPMLLRGDSQQLSRAFLNLVTNAVRHTRPGDRIRLACGRDDGWGWLEVADTGHGILEADLPRIFDPWYRTRSVEGGVGGLGLMIVREVARAHGGQVEVASVQGMGTAFTIRLPLLYPESHPALNPEVRPRPALLPHEDL